MCIFACKKMCMDSHSFPSGPFCLRFFHDITVNHNDNVHKQTCECPDVHSLHHMVVDLLLVSEVRTYSWQMIPTSAARWPCGVTSAASCKLGVWCYWRTHGCRTITTANPWTRGSAFWQLLGKMLWFWNLGSQHIWATATSSTWHIDTVYLRIWLP